jgi:hypothetical protein
LYNEATAAIERFGSTMIFQIVESPRLSNSVMEVIQYYYRYYHTVGMFRSAHMLRQWMRHTKNTSLIILQPIRLYATVTL